ncbi:MAG: TetR/AcrR family transcriptional regulator [Actinomycetota bacterium]
MPAPQRPYHHGNLSRSLLDAAAAVIDEVGPTQMSLREVARRTGVSHAAPVHHFGDKRGLFTALAAEGFQMLDADLAATRNRTDDFAEIGVAYVMFALTHRAHFEVMFRPELYDTASADVAAAAAAASDHLYGPSVAMFAPGTDRTDAGVFSWSLVHGLATLIINGNLDGFGPDASPDPEALARRITNLTRPAPKHH